MTTIPGTRHPTLLSLGFWNVHGLGGGRSAFRNKINDDVNKILDFYCPLLMKCSSQLDISSTTWLGWVKFKSNVCSLGPTAWSQCRMELAAEAGLRVVEALVFLDGVSERLYETCLRDTSLVNRLQDLNRRNTPKRIIRNDKATIERLKNTMEMNACLSLMHLFYLLYKKMRWNGLDTVTHFFEKMIGDFDATVVF